MALPVHVQFGTQGVSAATTAQVTLTGVASGNTIIVGIAQTGGAGARTFSIADDKGNTYSGDVVRQTNGVRVAELELANNVAAGDTVITVTASGSCDFAIGCAEVSGLSDTAPSDASSGATNASGTTHNEAASGAIDTTTDVYVFGVLACDGAHGGCTEASGFTELADSARRHFQYRTSSSALADERGTVTTTNSVASAGCIASFKADAAAGGDLLLRLMGEGLFVGR